MASDRTVTTEALRMQARDLAEMRQTISDLPSKRWLDVQFMKLAVALYAIAAIGLGVLWGIT